MDGDATSPLIGRSLGPYVLEALIGSGAFGRVYRARHRSLEVLRAVKVMQADIADDPEFRERFLREARTAARLTHPCIVPVFDIGVEGDIHYIVMDYVESRTLAEHLERLPARGRVQDATTQGCVRDVASALDYAHAADVVHRDLKPANVLVRTSDGRALLTDFGIARVRSDVSLTMTGRSVGTYAYMSPEQCGGVHDLTARSDIYSLAAIVYEIATGGPPFGRGLAAVAGHMNRPAPPVQLADPQLPEELNAVLGKGLAKAPQDRYGSAGELADAYLGAIRRWVEDKAADQTVIATVPGPWRPPVQPVVPREPAPAPPAPRLPRLPPLRRLPRVPWLAPAIRRGLGAIGAVASRVPAWVFLGVVLAAGLGVLLTVVVIRIASLTPQPQPAPLPTPVAAAVGRQVQVGGAQVMVISVNTNAAPPPATPLAPGSRLVTVQVVFQNTGRGPEAVSPYDWLLSDSSGALYGAVAQPGAGALPERQLEPGGTVRGLIGFEVPSAARRLVLAYDAELGDESATVPLG
jgi:tRNA A-37 threonylcarbamoyl transferase component Bud32